MTFGLFGTFFRGRALAVLVGGFGVAGGLGLSAAAQAPAAGPAAPPVRSPQLSADRRVTFHLFAPGAHAVSVAGEFMKGTLALAPDGAGGWSVTVGPLEPEIYFYNLTVDGVRTIDPGNPDLKSGSTAETIQSVLTVPGAAAAFYDGQPVPHGEIRSRWYQSKTLGTLRRLTVYVPPGYDLPDAARLPVLYLLHGANADETAWTRLGHVNLILDNLLAANKIKPFLVVMPFGYGVPPGGPGPRGENTARFSADLRGDVIPLIDAEYRTAADREHRAIFGLSMGGAEALAIGLTHRELFSYVGGLSAGLASTSDYAQTYPGLVADPAAANAQLHLLWVSCGRDDALFPASRRLDAFLTAHQITHTFRETAGEHTWMVWRRNLLEAAPLLFR